MHDTRAREERIATSAGQRPHKCTVCSSKGLRLLSCAPEEVDNPQARCTRLVPAVSTAVDASPLARRRRSEIQTHKAMSMLLLRAAVQRCTTTTRRRLAAQNRPSASAARTTAPWASFAEFLDAADEERAATRPATTDTWSCPAPADVPPEPTVSYAAFTADADEELSSTLEARQQTLAPGSAARWAQPSLRDFTALPATVGDDASVAFGWRMRLASASAAARP